MLELALAAGLFMGGPDHQLTCESTQVYTAADLKNGDHINMDIVQDGKKFQVNAYVDLNVPSGWKNLGVRLSDGTSRPLSKDEVQSGVLNFEYAKLLKGDKDFTVEWVQYNSEYFNKDRNPDEFLHCKLEPEAPPVPEKPADIVTVKKVKEVQPPQCVEGKEVTVTKWREETTTVTHEYDEATNTWIEGASTTEVTKEWETTKKSHKKCDDEPLPDTGFKDVALGGFAALLFGGGAVALYASRKRQAE